MDTVVALNSVGVKPGNARRSPSGLGMPVLGYAQQALRVQACWFLAQQCSVLVHQLASPAHTPDCMLLGLEHHVRHPAVHAVTALQRALLELAGAHILCSQASHFAWTQLCTRRHACMYTCKLARTYARALLNILLPLVS